MAEIFRNIGLDYDCLDSRGVLLTAIGLSILLENVVLTSNTLSWRRFISATSPRENLLQIGSFFWYLLGRLELKELQNFLKILLTKLRLMRRWRSTQQTFLDSQITRRISGKHQLSGGQPPEAFLKAFQVAAK